MNDDLESIKRDFAALARLTKAQGKAAKLSKIRVDEVSAVDRPASPGANIALFKRDNGNGTAPIMKSSDAAAALDEIAGRWAEHRGIAKSAAFAEIAAHPDVQRLRDAHDDLRAAEIEAANTATVSKSSSAEQEIERLAKAKASADGITHAQSTVEVLKTDHGKKLYAEYVAGT